MSRKEHLKNIVKWLNKNYNQNFENYSIFEGAKPEVVRYDEHTAISLWACGAIVCIESLMYFISEDDGYWSLLETEIIDNRYDDEYWSLLETEIIDNRYDYGYQSCFSIGWAKSFSDAMKKLEDYVNENGEPVYYSGTNTICHYKL